MTRPRIEPWSPKPLANTLPTWTMSQTNTESWLHYWSGYYPTAEMQLAYSTALTNWAFLSIAKSLGNISPYLLNDTCIYKGYYTNLFIYIYIYIFIYIIIYIYIYREREREKERQRQRETEWDGGWKKLAFKHW